MRKNYVGLVLGVCLFTTLRAATPAQSAVVTSCDETSLRAAIAQGGTVTFACDGVITLANTLAITSDLTLDASGRNVVLSGGKSTRVFSVESGASLTAMRLNIANGKADRGGAILTVVGTSVILDRCSVSNNQAVGPNGAASSPGGPGFGGAIANGGTLRATACAFSGNIARGGKGGRYEFSPSGLIGGAGEGGGVHSTGMVFLTNCVFTANSAEGGNGGDAGPIGGGIGGPGGDAHGGAISATSGLVIGVNTVIEGNRALGGDVGFAAKYAEPGGSASGGGLHAATDLQLTQCTLRSNTAAGGISTAVQSSTGGDARGGGVSCITGLNVIRECRIENNVATGGAEMGRAEGAGLFNSATTTVMRCSLLNNSATGGRASRTGFGPGGNARGGGIHNRLTLSLSDSTLANNRAQGGSGIDGCGFCSPAAPTPFIAGGDGQGGGIYNAGQLDSTNCTLAGNQVIPGPAFVESSTRSGPPGTAAGSAVFNETNHLALFNYVTVAGNIGTNGSIRNLGSLHLRNSILGASLLSSNCFGPITDVGHNISSDNSANFTAPTSRNNLDPVLGPLANNGGPTLTMALRQGSPAIDAGDSVNCPAADQRGVARHRGIGCDIGAYESDFGVIASCTDEQLRAAADIGGVFSFNCDGTVVLSNALVIAHDTVLDATGRSVVLSGNFSNRVFEVLPGASLTLVNLTIRDGVSTNGGGIFVDHGELRASGCRFVNNLAQGTAGRDEQNGASATSGGMARGGAIFGSSALLMLTNNVFLENHAKGGMGGVVGNFSFVFPDGGNASGGAVAGDDLMAVSINCRFETNHSLSGLAGSSSQNAGTVGSVKGGAWEQTTGSAHFEECAFIGNLAQAPFLTKFLLSGAGGSSSGGALFLGAGTMGFENVRFERNAALGGRGHRNSSGGSAAGGAVANLGNITLTRCLVTGNRATPGDGGRPGSSGYGGAIQNLGTLSATECWFEKNSVSGAAGYRGGLGEGRAGHAFGGAIWNTGRLDIAASTFSLNSAVGVDGGLARVPVPGGLAGGGALANSGFFTGTNLTFANNAALGGHFPFEGAFPSAFTAGGTAVGGALFQWGGTSVLAHVTMASNSAIGGDGSPNSPGLGGGIAVSNGVVSLTATIVADSFGASNCFGSILDGGINICSDASAGFSAPGSANNLNPVLGPLADYGGHVPTVALLGGSPAIDAAGTVNCPATDERGISRPFGSACDIGAFESSPPYTILGRVSGYLTPPGGIQINAGVFATTPDQTGRFAMHGLPAGTHLVVPASADAVFVNSNRLVTIGPDIAGMEFWSYRTNALVLEKAGAGTVRGIFAAAPGQTFHVEVSDNFSSWSPFSTQTTASSGLFEFWDTNSAIASPRLFRVKSP